MGALRLGDLEVVAVHNGDEPLGVAALCRDGAGVVRFLGSYEVSDYPGAAVAPGRIADVAHGLPGGHGGDGWTALDLRNARPQDGLVAELEAAARAARFRVRAERDEPVAVLALPGEREAYLGG